MKDSINFIKLVELIELDMCNLQFITYEATTREDGKPNALAITHAPIKKDGTPDIERLNQMVTENVYPRPIALIIFDTPVVVDILVASLNDLAESMRNAGVAIKVGCAQGFAGIVDGTMVNTTIIYGPGEAEKK